MSDKSYDVIRGPDRDRSVGSGRAAIVDKAPWLRHAAKKDDPAHPSPMPSWMRDHGAGASCPTGCEVMRPSLPHGGNGLEPRIRGKGDQR